MQNITLAAYTHDENSRGKKLLLYIIIALGGWLIFIIPWKFGVLMKATQTSISIIFSTT